MEEFPTFFVQIKGPNLMGLQINNTNIALPVGIGVKKLKVLQGPSVQYCLDPRCVA